MSHTAQPATSFKERVATLVSECASHRETLEARKSVLTTERDAEITATRERYATELDELVDEIKTIDRLIAATQPRQYTKREEKPEKQKFVPVQEKLDEVLVLLHEGNETRNAISANVDYSTATVDAALKHLREIGFARIKGKPKGETLWAATPAGKAHAIKLQTGDLKLLGNGEEQTGEAGEDEPVAQAA